MPRSVLPGASRTLARLQPNASKPLGGGWVAEEALAIALYAVLATDSFAEAVVLAANHGGDSDSTGAIAGNLAGIIFGEQAIPAEWLERLELRPEISQVAEDLHRARGEIPNGTPNASGIATPAGDVTRVARYGTSRSASNCGPTASGCGSRRSASFSYRRSYVQRQT